MPCSAPAANKRVRYPKRKINRTRVLKETTKEKGGEPPYFLVTML